MCIAVFVRACVCMYVKWGKVGVAAPGVGVLYVDISTFLLDSVAAPISTAQIVTCARSRAWRKAPPKATRGAR